MKLEERKNKSERAEGIKIPPRLKKKMGVSWSIYFQWYNYVYV